MPRVINDQMVDLAEEDKDLIRDVGYKECAIITRKTESYMRSLASKGENGPTRIRYSDITLIQRLAKKRYRIHK